MIRLWTPRACRAARSAMLDGIEGRLGVRERLDVEDHVSRCAACTDEVADLAAGHHAARRALAPYRRVRARVAPARARLRGYGVARIAPGLERLLVLGRRAEQALVFAVLALAFLGTLPSEPATRAASRDVFAASYLRAPDDPGGLLRLRSFDSDRIPVEDGLVIQLIAPDVARVAGDRLRQGLVPSRSQ